MIQLEKGLSLERLQTLCLVVRAGSIAAAAVGDLTRQSQYSRQLKELEAAVNKPLLRREGKLLKPTPVGIDLASIAGFFFAGLAEITTPEENVKLILGASDSVIRYLIIPKAHRFPTIGTSLQFRSLRTRECSEGLRTGAIDLSIVRDDAASDDFTTRPIGEIEHCWVFPRKCLPGRTAAGIYDAGTLPFAMLSSDGKLARQLLEISSRNRLKLDIKIELETFSLIMEAVRMEAVGAVLPSPAAESLPVDRFAILQDREFQIPARSLVLAALTKAYEVRPRLRRCFDEIYRTISTSREV